MTTTHFSIISPLASPEAPARLALPSRLAFSVISPLASPEAPARLALPSRLAFSVISPLASPEAPARLALPSARIFGHFTARLAGGTGSARTTVGGAAAARGQP